jgi:hypothetical protein
LKERIVDGDWRLVWVLEKKWEVEGDDGGVKVTKRVLYRTVQVLYRKGRRRIIS